MRIIVHIVNVLYSTVSSDTYTLKIFSSKYSSLLWTVYTKYQFFIFKLNYSNLFLSNAKFFEIITFIGV